MISARVAYGAGGCRRPAYADGLLLWQGSKDVCRAPDGGAPARSSLLVTQPGALERRPLGSCWLTVSGYAICIATSRSLIPRRVQLGGSLDTWTRREGSRTTLTFTRDTNCVVAAVKEKPDWAAERTQIDLGDAPLA